MGFAFGYKLFLSQSQGQKCGRGNNFSSVHVEIFNCDLKVNIKKEIFTVSLPIQ